MKKGILTLTLLLILSFGSTQSLPKSQIEFVKQLIELQLENDRTALQLQAKEIERRLENLNGEAAHLRSIQAQYVPREVFEANLQEVRTKIEALQKIVWIGIGGVFVLQIVLGFIKFGIVKKE